MHAIICLSTCRMIDHTTNLTKSWLKANAKRQKRGQQDEEIVWYGMVWYIQSSRQNK